MGRGVRETHTASGTGDLREMLRGRGGTGRGEPVWVGDFDVPDSWAFPTPQPLPLTEGQVRMFATWDAEWRRVGQEFVKAVSDKPRATTYIKKLAQVQIACSNHVMEVLRYATGADIDTSYGWLGETRAVEDMARVAALVEERKSKTPPSSSRMCVKLHKQVAQARIEAAVAGIASDPAGLQVRELIGDYEHAKQLAGALRRQPPEFWVEYLSEAWRAVVTNIKPDRTTIGPVDLRQILISTLNQHRSHPGG